MGNINGSKGGLRGSSLERVGLKPQGGGDSHREEGQFETKDLWMDGLKAQLCLLSGWSRDVGCTY